MTKAELASSAVPAGAISSPLWLPSVHAVSERAADLLPIFGLLWLSVQITFKLWQWWRIFKMPIGK